MCTISFRWDNILCAIPGLEISKLDYNRKNTHLFLLQKQDYLKLLFVSALLLPSAFVQSKRRFLWSSNHFCWTQMFIFLLCFWGPLLDIKIPPFHCYLFVIICLHHLYNSCVWKSWNRRFVINVFKFVCNYFCNLSETEFNIFPPFLP